jgi:hypothetical protein
MYQSLDASIESELKEGGGYLSSTRKGKLVKSTHSLIVRETTGHRLV